jgi:hypothetical protein
MQGPSVWNQILPKHSEEGRKMKRLTLWLTVVALVFSMASLAAANNSYTLTASQIKSVMSSYGAPLDDTTNLWGLWAVRTMPIVTGGSYTIDIGATTQTGWGVSTSSYGNTPYAGTNSAWFWDDSGAEVSGELPNPLYMIMDKSAGNFTSYYGNTVTAVDGGSTFTVNFTLGSGASWDGRYQFVVDGSRYTAGTTPAPWNADFFGGYGTGGGLTSNMGAGYQVPLPPSMLLLGSGLLGLVGLGWRRARKES